MYTAEITRVDQKIIVAVMQSASETVFRRSFYAICDAEHWLIRLARSGMRKPDCVYLLERDTLPFELPPLGVIRISDKRSSKRFALPDILT